MVPRLLLLPPTKPFLRQFGSAASVTVIEEESLTSVRHVTSTSCASLLRSCAKDNALTDGRRAHDLIVSHGFDQNKLLANLLVHMYGSCGELYEARYTFSHLCKRDPFSWNFMITAYTRHGSFNEALALFDEMHSQGIIPDKFILASIISACAESMALEEGRQTHIMIIVLDLELDAILSNALIHMYSKCGCVNDAKTMFLAMECKIDASWNAIISGCSQNGLCYDVTRLFNQMMMEAAIPTKVTFLGALSACADDKASLDHGKQFHALLSGSDYKSDLILMNTLINMYGKCDDMKRATDLFNGFAERSIVSWNSMITLYSLHDQHKKAVKLFHHLHQEGALANCITFRSLLAGFNNATVKECKMLHIFSMSCNFDFDVNIVSSLMQMYCKCFCFTEAEEIFYGLPEKDILVWNALISGFSQLRFGEKCHLFFLQMLQEGILPDKTTFLSIISGCANRASLTDGKQVHALLVGSEFEMGDVFIGSTLLNMYGKCGSVHDAYLTFSYMLERNEYSWAAMIAAYAENGQAKEAMALYERMLWEGCCPDRVCIINILSACSNLSCLFDSKRAHVHVLGSEYQNDVSIGNALVTMYSKCGNLVNARKVFKTMQKNLVSWTAGIAACAQHGLGNEALQYFKKLQAEGQLPDRVAYGEILVACSHAGLVNEGIHILISMKQKHDITPTVDHYNCLIDLLTRSGRLDLAEYVIFNMPLRPTAVSWLTLLGACRSQLDLDRGERAALWAVNLCHNDPTPFVTLSNIYASIGNDDDKAFSVKQMCFRDWDRRRLMNSCGKLCICSKK